MSLGELPVWQGVQEQPGFRTLPFILELERGVVRLSTKAVDTSEVVARYHSPAYTFISTPPGLSEWGNRLGNWYFAELAEAVHDLSGKTVLEIGAGTRYLAERVVKELDARRVILCDPAMDPKLGTEAIEVVPEYFNAAIFRNHQIDLVVSVNNLEHVTDPFHYLADVRQLLDATGGVCFVVVPECSRQLQVGDWGMCVHEHLSYFTQTSFVSAVQEAGFSIHRLKMAEDTLLASLGLARPQPADHPEANPSSLMAVGRRFEQSLQRVRERLSVLRNQRHRRLALHGCTEGLNNVLARVGIDSDSMMTLFDGDSAKTGKFLPSFSTPIRHARDPVYRSMTDLIIAATTFYEEIRSFVIGTHQFDSARIEALFPVR